MNFFKQLFCKHDWYRLKDKNFWVDRQNRFGLKQGYQVSQVNITLKCHKCGKIKVEKNGYNV